MSGDFIDRIPAPIAVVLLTGFTILVVAVLLWWSDGRGEKAKCTAVSITWVDTVGGCDRLGTCGVMYANGEYDRRDHPVVGQQVEIEEEVECKK